MTKRIYILLLLIGVLVTVSANIQAQIYSTAQYHDVSARHTTSIAEPFSTTPSFGSTSTIRLRSTSSQSYHSYSTSGDNYSTSNFIDIYRHFIPTKATSIRGGVLVDNVGYIATPKRNILNNANTIDEGEDDISGDEDLTDDDNTQAPPQFAPLHFSWDVIILLLLLASVYAWYLRFKLAKKLQKLDVK